MPTLSKFFFSGNNTVDKQGSTAEVDIEKLMARIRYLEQENQWHHGALEVLASLGDMHKDISQSPDKVSILKSTSRYIQKVAPFHTMAFYLREEPEPGFNLVLCTPEDHRSFIQEAADEQIENGNFAFALRQNRGLIVGESDEGNNLVLHALVTESRVFGVFVGKPDENLRKIPKAKLNVLTVILQNAAYAIENRSLYKTVSDQNRDLELAVRSRTKELEGQALKLEQEIMGHLKTAKAFRESHQQVKTIVENMMDGIVTLDELGEVKSFNPAAQKIFQYSEKEMIGQHISQVIPDFTHSEKDSNGKPFQLGPGDVVGVRREWSGRRKDGTTFPLEMGISEIPLGDQSRFVGILRDTTERREAETRLKDYADKLEHSNRELQDFASIASHDLQEPLRKIIAFGDRLGQAAADLDPRAREYLDRIQKAASRMQDFIEDLLLLSRVTTGARDFEATDLNEIIGQVLDILELRIYRTGASIEVGKLPTLQADPFQMRQLFQNLIGNALKFHREDVAPVVEVSSSVNEEGDWTIKIQDNGIGFDEKYLQQIFRPFSRLHGRSEYEGTGMGLAICKKIVDRHHGRITAKSWVDEGTCFKITLPKNHKTGKE